MKFHLTILITILNILSLSINAQEINPKLSYKTWLEKETREINGYMVTKVFGVLPHTPSAYNYMPLTAVAYKNPDQLKEEFIAKSKEEGWEQADLDAKLAELETNSKGGAIEVYISRYEENNANFRWFFLIIRGENDDEKLWEQELGYQAPQNPYERGWWNYTTVFVPVEVEVPFYIYLNDKHSGYLSDFKFLIEKPTVKN